MSFMVDPNVLWHGPRAHNKTQMYSLVFEILYFYTVKLCECSTIQIDYCKCLVVDDTGVCLPQLLLSGALTAPHTHISEQAA